MSTVASRAWRTLNIAERQRSGITVQAGAPAMPLLYALRNDLGLQGPRFGCGLAQCGACTVQLNGEAVSSCITPISAAAGKAIVIFEDLGTAEKPHPPQEAFIAEQSTQCGYCINGMIMQAAVLKRIGARAAHRFPPTRSAWAQSPAPLMSHPTEHTLGKQEMIFDG